MIFSDTAQYLYQAMCPVMFRLATILEFLAAPATWHPCPGKDLPWRFFIVFNIIYCSAGKCHV